ncbi:MAG: T9SS type A sorting domain-containing protein [Ginsengibacter sp.]
MKNKWICVAYLMLMAISAGAQSKSFKLYKQVRYKNTPTSLMPFLQPFVIANQNNLTDLSTNLPRQSGIDSFALTCQPGVPVCLDLETWPYYPSADLTNTINNFLTTISYFKATNTSSPIGFYGVPPKQAYQWSSIDPVNNPSGYAGWKSISDNLAPVAKNVDVFQPSFYTYDTDTSGWRKMVDTTIAALKRYSTTKPIYAFIWPQYHQGTDPVQLQFIDTSIWRYQLETLYNRADGVIIWTSNKNPDNTTISWDVNMPWWQTTKSFMVAKKLSQPFVLDSFKVSSTGSNANINWSTAVDTTTYRFIVQRSTDGGYNFLSVSDSIVPVSTHYTENNYQYTDMSAPTSGGLHYRLKMVNKDGSITYTSTSVAAFTGGTLAVLRMGGVNGTNGTAGSSTPGTSGTPIHIDKYSVSAGVFTYISSIDLPVAGTNNIFASSSTNEGYITLSGNKQWLSVMGYAAKSASGTIYNTTTNSNLARTLGLIKYDGTVDLSTALSNFPASGTAATAQASITNDGTDLWCVTNQGVSPMGVLYTKPGATDATSAPSVITTSATGVVPSSKNLSIFGGDLYYTAASGNRIGTVSATGGLPVTAGSGVMTGIPIAAGSTSLGTLYPSQMVMFDLDPSILGYDVMYVTNTKTGLAGVYKYCKNADGQWVSYGTYGSATAPEGPYFGITGEVINGLPVLYVTTGVSATQNLATNQLLQLTESSGYNVNMSATATATTDATVSGMSGTIRGVAFFPSASYYYNGTGNLNDVTRWGTNIDGTGTAPANFTNDEQTFFITKGTNATLSANMVVSGVNSKIILGDGTNATSLTIPATFSITSEMDVYNNAVLNIQNTETPYLHFVAQNSTVNLAASSSQTISPIAYGNFSNDNNNSATINGTITVAGNMVQSGLLKGNATLIVPNGLINTGTIAPGNSPGLINVTGNFANAPVGKLDIELGGNTAAGVDYDLLAVSGNATIDGTLDIATVNGFVPVAGQTFTIVTAGAVSGTFATVNWPAGVGGTVTYTATTVELNIIAGALPLHLLSFTGSVLQNGRNQLQWKTANESNIDYFSIERSDNGNTFTQLLKQTAVGMGDNSYEIVDANPLPGLNFYRLKIVDKDGKFTYSDIIRLKNNANSSFSVFPNPAKNNLVVTHPAGDQQSFIRLVQADGKVVYRLTISVGAIQSSLDISKLTPGIYFVLVYAGNTTNTFKVVKE